MKKKIYCGILLSWIFIVMALFFLPFDKKNSNIDGRGLRNFRKATSVEEVISGEYMTYFEDYLEDQILGRTKYIEINSVFKRDVLLKNIINDRYVNKEGGKTWVFGQLESIGEEIHKNNKKAVQNTNAFLSAKNIPFYQNIYTVNTLSMRDQIPQYANIDTEKYLSDTDNMYADLGTRYKNYYYEFENFENKEDYFYRMDFHWNSKGAFYVYQDTVNRFNNELDFINTTPYSIDNFNVETYDDFWVGVQGRAAGYGYLPNQIKDSETMILPNFETNFTVSNDTGVISTGTFEDVYLDREMFENKAPYAQKYAALEDMKYGNEYVKIKNNLINDGSTLVVFRDSFNGRLVPYLSLNFDTIISMDYRFYNRDWYEQFINGNEKVVVLGSYNIRGVGQAQVETFLSNLQRYMLNYEFVKADILENCIKVEVLNTSQITWEPEEKVGVAILVRDVDSMYRGYIEDTVEPGETCTITIEYDENLKQIVENNSISVQMTKDGNGLGLFGDIVDIK